MNTTRIKKIINLHEEATHKKLRDVCKQYGASVHLKIRVADVLKIENSGLNKDEYRFALQSHFDFVVTNSKHEPLFAVEFDGHSHKKPVQKLRDEKKDVLCDKFNFPILRIRAKHLLKKYRNFDLLSWFIEVWFLEKSFYDAQKKGQVPSDEHFDPMSFIYISGRKESFPLWLSYEIRAKIQEIAKTKKYIDRIPSDWIGIDKLNLYHGLSWIMINDKEGIITLADMKKQNFPIVISEILSEILSFQLYEEIINTLKGKSKPKSKEYIDKLVKKYTEKYEPRSSSVLSRH